MRSPIKYGAQYAPSEPAGTVAASAERRSYGSRPNLARVQRQNDRRNQRRESPARLRHRRMTCQRSGMAWQKVCNRPLGSERRTIGGGKNHAGSSDGGADDSGARDAHTYSAGSLILPAPATTSVPARRPVAFAPAAESLPQISCDSKSLGRSFMSMPVLLRTSFDQVRCATSSINVPEASATSMADSPVRRKRT